jgi:hypothetical protein
VTDHDLEQIRAILQDALAPIESRLAAIEANIASWPDLHFLQAAAQQQQREASEARDSRRNVEIKLDEIYGSMATSSEITRLRTEVATSIEHERELDLRISAIESRLGVRNPLAPTE